MAAATAVDAAPAQPPTPPPAASPTGSSPAPKAAAAQPDAVWVDSQVHFAGAPDAGGSSAADAPAAPDRADRATPQPESDAATSTADTTAPPAKAARAAAAPETDEPVTRSRAEWEREVESRLQKALAKARKDWEREANEAKERISAEQAEQAREQERQRRIALAKRADAGDDDAREELAQIAVSEGVGLATALERQRAQEAAEAAARARIWQQHAASFGIAPDDEAAQEALAAPDFKSLNLALLARSQDAAVVDAMKAHPAVAAWHEAELKAALAAAKEAAYLNGQASALQGARGPELTASGSDDVPDDRQIELRYRDNPDDPAALAAYRKLRQKRGWR